MSKDILISTSTFAASDDASLKVLKAAGFSVKLNPFGRRLSKPELLELLPGHTGLIAGLETLDREVMSKSDLKVISRCGAGMDNVDLEAARDLGIIVTSTPLAPADAVAELTVGCMLNLARNVIRMDADLHSKRWSKKTGFLLKGKTVLIVGLGNIGRRVAELLAPFGVHVIVADPHLNPADVTFKVLDLTEALPLADIITLHCSAKQCLLAQEEFDRMKPGALLLNAARGHLIDEKALIRSLEANRLAGVWIDTFEQEPYDGPLTGFSQVLLTPHVGSYTVETRKNMEMEAARNLMAAWESLESHVRH